MTKTGLIEPICKHCGHEAHCGHSCPDETCDNCTECACNDCQPEVEENK